MLSAIVILATLLGSVFSELSFISFEDIEVKGYSRNTEKFKIRIKDAESISEHLPTVDIDKLTIIGQNLSILYPRSLSNMETLRILLVDFSDIFHIFPGAIRNVPNLKFLSFGNNRIEHIPRGLFNNLRIQVLDLSKNAIYKIDGDAFDNMPELAKIDLSYNMIRKIDNSWFMNTPKLVWLELNRNYIEEIPVSAFKNIANNSNEDYLPSINLGYNNIKKIYPGAFKELSHVNFMELNNNLIKHIDEKTFYPLHINILSLRHNRIRSLKGKLNIILPAETISLENNLFSCQHMMKLNEWARNQKIGWKSLLSLECLMNFSK